MQLAGEFNTMGMHGYSVQFSPFFPEKMACVASQNYGISGRGTLFYLDVAPGGNVVPVVSFDWSDGLFDVAWSETVPTIAVTASGDGSVQMWDAKSQAGPISVFKEHSAEVYCICWSLTRQEELFVSGSWDRTLKLWNPNSPSSVTTFTGHNHLIYDVAWSPHIPGCFASASGDHTVCVWDIRQPKHLSVVIPAHVTEVLSCDWCRYDQNLLASGGTDGLLRVWDLRKLSQCTCELQGHTRAVRRVRFSPHRVSVLASVSYDFTTRIWDYQATLMPIETIQHHSEFVYGLDFSLHYEGQIADCAFDEKVSIFHPKSLMPPQPQIN